MMRSVLSVCLLAAVVLPGQAQSGGDLLRFASPDSAALIGVEWRRLAASPTGASLGRQLESGLGPMQQTVSQLRAQQLGNGIGDWQSMVSKVDSVLVAIPDPKAPADDKKKAVPLVIVSGDFDIAALGKQAASKKAAREVYRTVELLRSEGAESPGFRIALADNHTIFLGDRRYVRGAIDRYLEGAAEAKSSDLIRRAGQISARNHIWLAMRVTPEMLQEASKNPGAAMLAGVRAIDGGLNFDDGLLLALNLNAKGENEAAQLAQQLRTLIAMGAASQPAESGDLLKRLSIAPVHSDVLLSVAVSQAELEEALRKRAEAATVAAAPVAAPPRENAPAPARTDGKIHIYGLDEGTREIPITPQRP